jgi:RNA polymerase sigma factor (sigma-70 family)
MDNSFSSWSDKDIWQQFKSGNEEAYSFMYEKYVPVLYSYGCRIHSNEEVVKDCLQDLFVTLWLSRQNLGSTDNIKFYLFRSLRREIARRHEPLVSFSQDTNSPFSANTETSFEDQLIALEEKHLQSKELEVALTYLSDRQREAVYLRFYQNVDFDEIAAIMGITPRAVYKLIYRAVDILKKTYIPKPSAPSALSTFFLIITAIVLQMIWLH